MKSSFIFREREQLYIMNQLSICTPTCICSTHSSNIQLVWHKKLCMWFDMLLGARLVNTSRRTVGWVGCGLIYSVLILYVPKRPTAPIAASLPMARGRPPFRGRPAPMATSPHSQGPRYGHHQMVTTRCDHYLDVTTTLAWRRDH